MFQCKYVSKLTLESVKYLYNVGASIGVISCRGYCQKNDITRSNLLINKDTRVICQGFTGKQVCIATKYYSNVLMHEIE